MSVREFKRWSYWLASEWDRPSRTDYYLMQLTMEVRLLRYQMASKTAKSVAMADMLIRFGDSHGRQEAIPETKLRWFAKVGYKRGRHS